MLTFTSHVKRVIIADSDRKVNRRTEREKGDIGRSVWDVKWVSVDTSRWIDPGCTLAELSSTKSLAYAGINTRLFACYVRPLSSFSNRTDRLVHSAILFLFLLFFFFLLPPPGDDSANTVFIQHNRLNHQRHDTTAAAVIAQLCIRC